MYVFQTVCGSASRVLNKNIASRLSNALIVITVVTVVNDDNDDDDDHDGDKM